MEYRETKLELKYLRHQPKGGVTLGAVLEKIFLGNNGEVGL